MTFAFALRTKGRGFLLDASARWLAPRCALFGASGSGKSTIVEAIAGFRPDVSGEVEASGRRLDSLPAADRSIGWAPQDAALFPHLSVGDNLAFAANARRRRGALGAAAETALDALEIRPLLARRAIDLSGGERQRVAIARALASEPRFLLLDEPLASIDRPLRTRIVPFLASLPARFGIPFLCVTHDPLEVLALADHVLVLESGRIVAAGPPGSIFMSASGFAPIHAIGAENVFDVAAIDAPSDGGTTRLRTSGGCALEMAAHPGFPAPIRVAIRSEDILVAATRPTGISAQNVLEAIIDAIEPLGPHVHLVARAHGETFRAKITARARGTLDLAPGRAVHLVIKAHAIVPAA